MSTDENKAVVRRFCDEFLNKANYAIADELLVPTYVFRSPGMPDVRTPAALKGFWSGFRSAFPDLTVTLDELIAEGDKVVSRWHAVGTHKGDLMGVPPTGKKVTLVGMTITTLSGAKVVEDWEILDQMGMMQQLGAIPTPAPPAT